MGIQDGGVANQKPVWWPADALWVKNGVKSGVTAALILSRLATNTMESHIYVGLFYSPMINQNFSLLI